MGTPDHEWAVITLPAEIDIANSGQIGASLTDAAQRRPLVLIADMTITTFNDSAGNRVVNQAYRGMRASGTELRLVIPAAPVLRALAITGVDRMLPIYPSLGAAFAATSPRPA